MISVADLLRESRIPANYFDFAAYLRGDLDLGLLENRRGDRLIAIPHTLVTALYKGLGQETGQAARLVLMNCGIWWGKNFYTRFTESLEEYYGAPLAEMSMGIFIECLKECWTTHGWGALDFEPAHQSRGLLVITTKNSPYGIQIKGDRRPSCFLEAGILTSFFSRLSGQDLLAVQTTCESLGDPQNTFILGLTKRLEICEALLSEGLSHEAVLQRLLN
jgi:predicted hydrocarbon binding protein